MNIRHTKPGHIYGVSDRTDSRYGSAERGTIFAVKAIALEGQYEKANPDYWSTGSGKANGLTVEIQETVIDREGNPCKVTLPGMGEEIEVKEGNVVVISGRSIHWGEEAYRAIKKDQAEQAERQAAKDAAKAAQRNSLKERMYSLGLRELDEYPEDTGIDWYPPYIGDDADWERLLALLEAREGVNA